MGTCKKAPRHRRFPDVGRRELIRAAGASATALLLSGLAIRGDDGLLLLASADQTAFVGAVVDLLTGRPIPGATVRAEPTDASATAGADGAYQLPLPPGSYTLRATAPGYVPLALAGRELAPGATSVASFELIREGLSLAEEEAVYARLGLQAESPAQDPAAATLGAATVTAQSLPDSIVVRSAANPDVYTTVSLEDYVKGVVPNEVPYSWPSETLKAQAVAARSYGVVSYLAKGFVWDDVRDQIYNPGSVRDQTNAAVDASRGVVVTYGGGIAKTFFFSRCDGATTRHSESAINWRDCSSAGWNRVEYCRARGCGGHERYANSPCGYYGHGVGMCQWGAWARGGQGTGYQDILRSYYTSVEVVSLGGLPTPALVAPVEGALALPGAIVLRWTATGASYSLQITPPGGAAQTPVATSDTSYSLNASTLGVYSWRVQAIRDGQYSAWSASRTIRVVERLWQTYLPKIEK